MPGSYGRLETGLACGLLCVSRIAAARAGAQTRQSKMLVLKKRIWPLKNRRIERWGYADTRDRPSANKKTPQLGWVIPTTLNVDMGIFSSSISISHGLGLDANFAAYLDS